VSKSSWPVDNDLGRRKGQIMGDGGWALPSPCNTRIRTSGNDGIRLHRRRRASDIVGLGLDEDDLRQWLCCGALLLRIVIAAFLHHHAVSGLLPHVSSQVLAARTNSFCMV
jgi:hypothetical protein